MMGISRRLQVFLLEEWFRQKPIEYTVKVWVSRQALCSVESVLPLFGSAQTVRWTWTSGCHHQKLVRSCLMLVRRNTWPWWAVVYHIPPPDCCRLRNNCKRWSLSCAVLPTTSIRRSCQNFCALFMDCHVSTCGLCARTRQPHPWRFQAMYQ